MKEIALKYYDKGAGCSGCILIAATERFGIEIDGKPFEMTKALNGGLGVGCVCGCILAAIMVFGLLFDEDKAKELRLRLLLEIQTKEGSIHCSELKGDNKEDDCHSIVAGIADILERLVVEQLAEEMI